MAKAKFPDGISGDNIADGNSRRTAPIRLFLLLLLVGTALTGLLGGGPARRVVNESSFADLTIEAPRALRNGMFFETRITARARGAITDAVIAVPGDYWRDITINSMIPTPTEEEGIDGEYRFHFGPLESGKTLALKIDGQVNPPRMGGSGGYLRLLDGEAELARVPVSLKVLP